MKIKKKQPLRFSSNNPAVFASQVIIFFTIVFTLSYGLYVVIFNNDKMIDATLLNTTESADAADVLNIDLEKEGVSESSFVETPANVDSDKIKTLFPEIKN